MTESSFTMPNLAALTEVARLTKTGRLQDATDLIQRSLKGNATPGPQTIDPTAKRIETRHQPGPDASSNGDVHAAILPTGLRDTLDQMLRGIAPVIKGLKGGLKETGFHGRPQRPSQPDDDHFVDRTFSNAAGAREYKLFIPSRHDGKRPLVVMLHGCSQTPEDFSVGTRMNALAEERGLYVAYPRQTRGANLQRCWNWFEPGDQGREHGEAGVIAGIARAVMAEHDIDPARIYIAGLSAGGAAAANIARAYPDLFAAVGIHSGLAAGCARDLSSAMMAMTNGAPGGTTPGGAGGFGGGTAAHATHIPAIVFHGDSDATVNPRNAQEALAQAGISGLRSQRENGGNGQGHSYTRTRYLDEAGRTQAEAWIVKGAGHAWSGGSPNGSYTDPRGPDASRAMLDFFGMHTLGNAQA